MDFDERRRRKYAAGRRERGLGKNDPFAGNPAEELQNEALDIPNYADQLLADGDMSEQEADRYLNLGREIYLHMEAVKKRRAERLMKERRSYHAEEVDDFYVRV